MKPKAVAVLIAALLVAGGGAFAFTRLMAPAEDAAISFTPADSLFYTTVFVRPSNGQKRALDELLRKFPGLERTDDVVVKLTELVDRHLAGDGLSYETDVEPWLGDQVALFVAPGEEVSEPHAAVLVESKDDRALVDFLDGLERKATGEPLDTVEREHGGVAYELDDDADDPTAFAFHDGFFVLGTEGGVKAAIDAAAGESLADAQKFQDATAPLTDDWIGRLYVDGPGIFETFGEELDQMTAEERALFEALGLDEEQSSAASLSVTSDSIVLEGAGGLPDDGAGAAVIGGLMGGGIVPDLPGEAWFAAGSPDVGDLFSGYLDLFAGVPGFDREQIDAQLRQQVGLGFDDLFGWMGDAGFFVEGTTLQTIGLGLVVDSSEPGATAEVVGLLEELLVEEGLQPDSVSRAGLEGFSVQPTGVPAPVYVLGGDRLVISFGDRATDAILTGEGTLAGTESFRAASDDLGDGFEVGFFVDVDGAQALLEAALPLLGDAGDVYEQKVKQYLEPFAHVAGGSKTEGDTIVTKLVIGVR